MRKASFRGYFMLIMGEQEASSFAATKGKGVLWRIYLKEHCQSVHTVGGKGRCCCELIEPALKVLYHMESLCHTVNFHFPLGQVGLTK